VNALARCDQERLELNSTSAGPLFDRGHRCEGPGAAMKVAKVAGFRYQPKV
jgi:hypothetical protein